MGSSYAGRSKKFRRAGGKLLAYASKLKRENSLQGGGGVSPTPTTPQSPSPTTCPRLRTDEKERIRPRQDQEEEEEEEEEEETRREVRNEGEVTDGKSRLDVYAGEEKAFQVLGEGA